MRSQSGSGAGVALSTVPTHPVVRFDSQLFRTLLFRRLRLPLRLARRFCRCGHRRFWPPPCSLSSCRGVGKTGLRARECCCQGVCREAGARVTNRVFSTWANGRLRPIRLRPIRPNRRFSCVVLCCVVLCVVVVVLCCVVVLCVVLWCCGVVMLWCCGVGVCSRFSWVRSRFGCSLGPHPLPRTAQNLALFFPSRATISLFFLYLWVSSR